MYRVVSDKFTLCFKRNNFSTSSVLRRGLGSELVTNNALDCSLLASTRNLGTKCPVICRNLWGSHVPRTRSAIMYAAPFWNNRECLQAYSGPIKIKVIFISLKTFARLSQLITKSLIVFLNIHVTSHSPYLAHAHSHSRK